MFDIYRIRITDERHVPFNDGSAQESVPAYEIH